MAKDKQENAEVVGLGEKLSNEHLSSGRHKWRTRVLLLMVVLLLGGCVYAYIGSAGSSNKYDFAKVTRKDLRETVQITGNVEAGATINLTFRASGQLEKVNYKVGDDLKKNNVIANLKNRDQQLQLSQAKSNLQGAQANLSQKLAGSTDEDVLIADSSVKKTETTADKVSVDWSSAKDELVLIRKKYVEDEKSAQLMVDDAKNKYDFAIKNQGNTGKTTEQDVQMAQKDLEAQLYSTAAQIQQSLIGLKSIVMDDGNSLLGSDYRRLDFATVNGASSLYVLVNVPFGAFYTDLKSGSGFSVEQLKTYAGEEKDWANQLLQAQKITLDGLATLVSSYSLSSTTIESLKTKMLSDNNSLSASAATLNIKYQALVSAELGLTSSSDSQDSTVISAKNFYDQQVQALAQNKIDHQVDLNSRMANIRDLEAQYKIALADIDSAKANLKQISAGPRAVDVSFLRTQVAVNQIGVDLANEALEKTLLRAPIDGILSRSNVDVGEDVLSSGAASAVSNIPAFEMISDQKFKINAEIAEVDINKLKVGDKAEITLDAVGNNSIFAGTITRIDPVQTMIQDVVFYKAEIVVDSEDPRIKPGMTATVDIVLKEAKGALTIPEKAIQTDAGKSFLRILDNGIVKNIPIETGIRDLQGNVEITSGVSEGQDIILKTNGK